MIKIKQISHTNDTNQAIQLPQNKSVTLEIGASVIESCFYGGFYLERYATVNRSNLFGPSGLGAFSYIADANVGPFVNIGARVSIGGYEHPKNWLSTSAFQWVRKPSLLGEGIDEELLDSLQEKPKSLMTEVKADVWIGTNAIVRSGVTLEVGTIIGAGAVVTKDTKPYGIYVGNPAVIKDFRFNEEIRETLLSIRWWEFPISFLMKLPFPDILKCITLLQEYRQLHERTSQINND